MYFEIGKRVRWSVAAAMAVLAVFAGPGLADLYRFTCITDNNPTHAAIGETQLSVEVTSYDTDQVLFDFRNGGSAASQITAVYFDDGSLLGIAQLIDRDEGGGDSYVDFSQGASPPNLQGGDVIGFVTTAGFSADADTPASKDWGVDPGESLGIVFDLLAGKTFQHVLSDLATGALRVGIYVEKFQEGGHESFVAVPVPAAILLGILGLGVAGLKLRKLV